MIARTARPRRVSLKKLAASGPQYSTITTQGKKPLKKVNKERQKKVAARQRKKHQAYMRSECRRIVDARADGRCEFTWTRPTPCKMWPESETGYRCGETEGLQHHHTHYSLRYGGNELPTDILVVCKAHHDHLESLKLADNRYTRARSA